MAGIGYSEIEDEEVRHWIHDGGGALASKMTKHEFIATLALQGLLTSKTKTKNESAKNLAIDAYNIAIDLLDLFKEK